MTRHLYRMWMTNDPRGKCLRVALEIETRATDKPRVGVADESGNIAFVEVEPASIRLNDCTFIIPDRDAQHVFDQLWQAGFRPASGRDAEGVHAAQREHIQDLRKVLDAVVAKV